MCVCVCVCVGRGLYVYKWMSDCVWCAYVYIYSKSRFLYKNCFQHWDYYYNVYLLDYVLICAELHSFALHWCRNERRCVSNHQPHDYVLNCLFRRRSKITSKVRATGLCAGDSSVTGEFSVQRASNAENDSIWWRQLGVDFVLQLNAWFSLIYHRESNIQSDLGASGEEETNVIQKAFFKVIYSFRCNFTRIY